MDNKTVKIVTIESQKKRKRNRENSTEILKSRGVEFSSHNKGAHLIVTSRYGLVDFWPGTGKFIVRKSGEKGRGVFNLLKMC